MQDSLGFIWIATIEGLSRFDGKDFKNFYAEKNDSIVKGNSFSNIYEFKKGQLVLTNGSRTICFDTYTERFYVIPISRVAFLSISQLTKTNTYYAAGLDKAYILDDKLQITDSINKPPLLPGANNWLHPFYFNINTILLDYNGSFYFYHIDSKTYEIIPVAFNFPGTVYFAGLKFYDSLKKELYFEEYLHGRYRYSLLTKKTELLNQAANGLPYSTGSLSEVIQKNKNELWLLNSGGINILDSRENTISVIQANPQKTNSLISNETYTCFFDRNDNGWIGTANGLSKLNANSLKIKSWADEFNTTPGSELMSVVKGADGNIYTSVYGGGAYTINSTNNKVSFWKHPLNQNNWNLFVKGNEVIRTGGGNRLLSFDTKTKRFKVFDFLKPYYPDIELITFGFVHSNGDEWYCANRGGGFVRKLAGSNNYKTYKKNDGVNHFSNGYYTSYTEDKNGDLWFGVNKQSKLLHWNYKTDKFNEIDFYTVKGTENILFNGINEVTKDIEGNIWVAFDGSGLLKYNAATNTAVQYTITDGLPTNFIGGLQFDDKNRLWLNTINGLCCFIIAENKFVNFKKEDGLPADFFTEPCHYFDTTTNKLWVAAGSTLMCFNPDELLGASRQNFPLYINEIYVDGKRYTDTLQNNLSFGSSQNNVQFHFVGVDFSKGKDIEYSYTLKGADKDWNYNGNNQSASYANLKPGKYLFKVKARHKGENKWVEIEKPLQFTIATPWNKSWWFILFIAAVIGFAIWLISRAYFLRRIEKQKAIIEKQAAISSERSRIAADMHDDMGAGLSRMRYLSTALQNEIKDEGLKKDFDKLISGSDELVDKMNDIIWTLNSGDEKLEEVVYYIRSQCSEILNNANIGFEYSLPESFPDKMISSEEKRNLYLVVKEAVHNAIKHSHTTQVHLSVEIHKRLVISVTDNGIGFNAEQSRLKGNGLSNYRKRMDTLKGAVAIESGEKGTTIKFEMPLA